MNKDNYIGYDNSVKGNLAYELRHMLKLSRYIYYDDINKDDLKAAKKKLKKFIKEIEDTDEI